MSITGAFSSALSGMTAASRAAELVASNLANARTEGYGRRVLELGARTVGTLGQGVAITGVRRVTDLVLINDRRLAGATAAGDQTLARFFASLETEIGTPGSEGSLSARIGTLDTALLEAASRPDSEARLQALRDALSGLTGKIGRAAASVQTARQNADHQIAVEIEALNGSLAQVADMNARILSVSSGGRDASALIDQRQQMIDRIGGLIPIREIVRDNGTVALMAPGGLMLLDGQPATLGFTPAGVIVPEMTQGSGALSGLTVNGRQIATSGPGNPLAGGRLGALFDIRDTSGVAAQAQLDALSRDLVERFADPTIDATRLPGGPGLLTDAGTAFLPANEVGLAQRLTLNPAADPAQGGALWRLRDGLGAATPGPPGESGLIRALAGALNAQRQPLSGSFMAGERGFATLAADLLSGVSGTRVQRDSAAAFSAASLTALQEIEAQDGVDSDQELQSLLQIEKAYAANAKVIQALDDMLQSLIGIG